MKNSDISNNDLTEIEILIQKINDNPKTDLKDDFKRIFEIAKDFSIKIDFSNIRLGATGRNFKKFHELFGFEQADEYIDLSRSYLSDENLLLSIMQEEEYLTHWQRVNCRHTGRLFEAAKNGDSEEIQSLMEKGVDINLHDSLGRTPLMIAAMDRQIDTTIMLISNGANIDAQTNSGFRIIEGLTNKLIGLNDESIEAKDTKNIIGLLWNKTKYQTLHVAIILSSDLDIVKTLPKKLVREQLNSLKHEYRPIHIAALKGYTEIIKWLIEEGADINLKDNYGRTALDIVEETNNYETAEFLKTNHGKRASIINSRGKETEVETKILSNNNFTLNTVLENSSNTSETLFSEQVGGKKNPVKKIIKEREEASNYIFELKKAYYYEQAQELDSHQKAKLQIFNDYLRERIVGLLFKDFFIRKNEVARPADWGDTAVNVVNATVQEGAAVKGGNLIAGAVSAVSSIVSAAVKVGRDASFKWDAGKTKEYNDNIVSIADNSTKRLTETLRWQICQLDTSNRGIQKFADFFYERLNDEIHQSSVKAGLIELGQFMYLVLYGGTTSNIAPEVRLFQMLIDHNYCKNNDPYIQLDKNVKIVYNLINSSRDPWNARKLLEQVGIIVDNKIYCSKDMVTLKQEQDSMQIEFKYGLRNGDLQEVIERKLKLLDEKSIQDLSSKEESKCLIS